MTGSRYFWRGRVVAVTGLLVLSGCPETAPAPPVTGMSVGAWTVEPVTDVGGSEVAEDGSLRALGGVLPEWVANDPVVRSEARFTGVTLGQLGGEGESVLRKVSLGAALDRLPASELPTLDDRTLDAAPVTSAATSWGTILGTAAPTQDLSWADVYERRATPAVKATSLADVALGSSPLQNVELAPLVLASARLGDLPMRRVGTRQEAFDVWCQYIDCAGLTPDSTIGEALALGASLQDVPLDSIPMRRVDPSQLDALLSLPMRRVDPDYATGLASVPMRRVDLAKATAIASIPMRRVDLVASRIGAIPMRRVDLTASVIGTIPISSISDPSTVVTCARTCPVTTLAEAQQAGLLVDGVTLAALASILVASDTFTIGELVGALTGPADPSDPTVGDLIRGLADNDPVLLRDLISGLPADDQDGDGYYDEHVTLADLLQGLLSRDGTLGSPDLTGATTISRVRIDVSIALEVVEAGSYHLELQLPEGADLEDGFSRLETDWNGDRGNFPVPFPKVTSTSCPLNATPDVALGMDLTVPADCSLVVAFRAAVPTQLGHVQPTLEVTRLDSTEAKVDLAAGPDVRLSPPKDGPVTFAGGCIDGHRVRRPGIRIWYTRSDCGRPWPDRITLTSTGSGGGGQGWPEPAVGIATYTVGTASVGPGDADAFDYSQNFLGAADLRISSLDGGEIGVGVYDASGCVPETTDSDGPPIIRSQVVPTALEVTDAPIGFTTDRCDPDAVTGSDIDNAIRDMGSRDWKHPEAETKLIQFARGGTVHLRVDPGTTAGTVVIASLDGRRHDLVVEGRRAYPEGEQPGTVVSLSFPVRSDCSNMPELPFEWESRSGDAPDADTVFVLDAQSMWARFGTRMLPLFAELEAIRASSGGTVRVKSTSDSECMVLSDRWQTSLGNYGGPEDAVTPATRNVVVVGSIDSMPGLNTYDFSVGVAPESSHDALIRMRQAMGTVSRPGGYLSPPGAVASTDISSELAGKTTLAAVVDGGVGYPVDGAVNRDTPARYAIGAAAVGRLVETPEEILAQLRDWETSTDRRVRSGAALVAGYDFLSDSAFSVASRLEGSGVVTDQHLISETWGASDLKASWTAASAPERGVSAINAHMDQYRILSAKGNAGSADDALVTTADLAGSRPKLQGSLVVTVGCHSGLSLPDWVYGDADPRSLDWPQALARAGVRAFVGSSGFGYGDTDAAAYSERLEELFVQQVQQQETVGEALRVAKLLYIAEHPTMSPYDLKALAGTVLYGLPMWKTPGANPKPGGDLPRVLSAADDSAMEQPKVVERIGTGVAAAPFNVFPDWARTRNGRVKQTVTDRGTFVPGRDGDVRVAPHQPVLGMASMAIPTTEGYEARGVIFDHLGVQRMNGVDPVVDQPTIVDRQRTDEPQAPGVYPSAPVEIVRAVSGQRIQLVSGRWRGVAQSPGTLDLFHHFGGRILFAPVGDPDRTAPSMTVSATVENGKPRFRVSALDGSGVWQLRIQYRSQGGDWASVDRGLLGRGTSAQVDLVGPERVPAAGAVDAIVQLSDTHGNVVTQMVAV